MEERTILKVALVTGSGSGIGRAIALRLARFGHPIVINDLDQGAGEAVRSEIGAQGGKGIFIKADVSDPAQVRAMFETARTELGPPLILVNNAGVPGAFSLIGNMPAETWHKTIAIHLHGCMYCMREALRPMAEQGFGRIINIASIAGLIGTVGSGEYAAAKAGMIALTKTAAKEAGPYGITVNAMAPGMVATPTNLMLLKKGSPFIETALAGTPTGRLTTPEELAELTLFLCSPAAANINGEVIKVDGGATVNIGMDGFMRDFLNRKNPLIQKTDAL